jgi:hypothetical protein
MAGANGHLWYAAMHKKGITPIQRIASKLADGGGSSDKGDVPKPGVRMAREVWNVVLEHFEVPERTIYAIYFHRRGSSVYYIHRHFMNRKEAERELAVLRSELMLPEAEFEARHLLDGHGV